MEARLVRAALIAAAVLCSLGANRPYYSVRSQHFIVTAPSPQLANEICQAAEQFRRDLAIEWLGHELPEWQGVCQLKADVAPNLGAGGATSFVFRGGTPTDFTMNIQGSRERILDSVLPHEVTHTVFATHFGGPLPRWADEGACTTVEHDSEKAKQDKFLIEFLTPDQRGKTRGIPFNKMFAMKDYPPDILPLYSQGFSLAKFFIQQGGKRKYVEYVGEGMRSRNWTATTQKYYGFHSLSDLQLTWVEWVRGGSPALQNGKVPEALLVSTQQPAATVAGATGSRSGNVGNTQLASLLQQPQSRIPEGALASWQTIQAQNARVFAQADQRTPPVLPASFARPAVVSAEAAPSAQSSVSRPVSDGWYSKRRDQALAILGSGGDVTALSLATAERPPAEATDDAAVAATTHRAPIVAEPLTPVANSPAATAADSSARGSGRIVMEWTRATDQPFRTAEVTGVAMRDTGTMAR